MRPTFLLLLMLLHRLGLQQLVLLLQRQPARQTRRQTRRPLLQRWLLLREAKAVHRVGLQAHLRSQRPRRASGSQAGYA